MNSRKTIQYLFLFIYLTWLIPWQGKQIWPAWFGASWIQWSSAALLAILCPFGMLLTLSLLPGKDRRYGFIYFLGFIAPILICLLFRGITPTSMAKSVAVTQPTYREIQVISQLTESARDPGKPPEKRLLAASFLYRFWGVVPVILGDDGHLVVYSPTTKDQSARQKSLAVRTEAEKDLVMIRGYINQMRRLFAAVVCTSSLVFIAGLAFFVFGRQGKVIQEMLPETQPASLPTEPDQSA